MRKIAVVVLSLFLVPLLALPANAERPVRESGSYEGLWASTSECDGAGTRTSCTDTYLDVWESPDGETFVCLWVDTYTIHRDRYRQSSTEEGCSIVDGSAFSASSTGTASLSDVVVEIGTWTCGQNSCRMGTTRTVTVSASLVGTGTTQRSSGRGTDTWEGCTYRYSYTSSGGSNTGTITLDGVAYAADGFAEQSTYKSTETCR